MPEFRITWQIDEIAENPVEACQQALHRMNSADPNDPMSATVFTWENMKTGETGILDLSNA